MPVLLCGHIGTIRRRDHVRKATDLSFVSHIFFDKFPALQIGRFPVTKAIIQFIGDDVI